MGRRRGAALAASCFAVSLAAAFTWVTVAYSGVQAGSWDNLLSRCSSASTKGTYDPSCIQATWSAAFDADDLQDFSESLLRLEQRHPFLGAQCHDAGHAAGRYAFSRSGSVRSLVSAAARDQFACDNGFVHGVLDGLAASSPSPEEVLDAYRTCEMLDGQARRNCLDGSGHMTWQVTRDPLEAARSCAQYSGDLDRRTCYAGVTMQMFHPQLDGSGPADVRVEDSPAFLQRTCPLVGEEVSRTMALACFETAYQPFTKSADGETRQYAQSLAEGHADDPGHRKRLVAEWLAGLSSCDVFAADEQGRDACRYKVAYAVGIAAPDPRVRDVICREMLDPADQLLLTCLRDQAGLTPPAG